MGKFVITESEKNRILNLHIERTKNLYLTEQQNENKITDEISKFLLKNQYVKMTSGNQYTKIKNEGPGYTNVKTYIKPNGTYTYHDVNTKKQLAKGTWTWNGTTIVKSTPVPTTTPTPTPTPTTGELYEWAECIQQSASFEQIKNDPKNQLQVIQKDGDEWDIFYKDGNKQIFNRKKTDGTVIRFGKWKCLPTVNLFIECDNGDKYFNGKWYTSDDAIKIPSFDTIKEKGLDIIGKIGDKLVKWWNDGKEWIDDKSNDGSSNDNKPCTPLTDSEKKSPDFYNIRIPGDTKYIYGKDGKGNWFTKNIVNKDQFNLTKCGYTKAIKKLEKEGKQVSTPQKTELDNVKSAPNDKVNIAVVEPKPETTPLATSDKVLDGQEEMSATTKL